MGKSMEEGKLAVDSGYWPLYRFNPELAEQGKAPLTLESKAPDGTLRDFLAGENRYAQLKSIAPQDSERLQNDLEKAYNDRYQLLKYMAAFSGSAEQPKACLLYTSLHRLTGSHYPRTRHQGRLETPQIPADVLH